MMSNRRPGGALAAVLIAAAATSTFSHPAQAAPEAAPKAPTQATPTCYATSCHGLDPIETHCVDDAVTIDDAAHEGRIVRLRYSAQCRAAWAQLWFGKPEDRAYVRTEENGHLVAATSVTVMPWDGNSVYTPMVNDKNLKAKACMELPPDSDTACTISY